MKTALRITRAENFADWYQEVIKEADLAEHSGVRGCMVIKPWGWAIWEHIQARLDAMIKATGHRNCYFRSSSRSSSWPKRRATLRVSLRRWRW